jgi:hypothetical protein
MGWRTLAHRNLYHDTPGIASGSYRKWSTRKLRWNGETNHTFGSTKFEQSAAPVSLSHSNQPIASHECIRRARLRFVRASRCDEDENIVRTRIRLGPSRALQGNLRTPVFARTTRKETTNIFWNGFGSRKKTPQMIRGSESNRFTPISL